MRMGLSVFVLVCVLLTPMGRVSAVSLTPLRLTDGGISVPCDAAVHTIVSIPVNAYVVKAYLFTNMSPNTVKGMDAGIYSIEATGPVALAETHLLVATPSGGIQGQMERTFEPDSVFVTQVEVQLVCYGGDFGQAFAEIWTRPTP